MIKTLKLAEMSLAKQKTDSLCVLRTIEAGDKKRFGMGEGRPEREQDMHSS